MKLLIDADSGIYKAGCSNETREYLVQDKETGIVLDSFQYKAEADAFIQGDESLEAVFTKRAGDLSHSLANAKNFVTSILDSVPHTSYRLYIGGEGNFRRDLYPEYKMHRDPNAKPIHEKEIRDYLIRAWGAEPVHGEEADDKVSYECCADPEGTTIVGIDKDLWNTPGWHYNPDKRVLEEVSLEQADASFWQQMLTGDPSDNIPCLKGVGPKTAQKILMNQSDYEEAVYKEYHERGYTFQYFVLMGRLLWLRRKPQEMWLPQKKYD